MARSLDVTRTEQPAPRRAGRAAAALLAVAFAGAAAPMSADAQSGPRPGQRVAVVTGSTSGLGQELAMRLAAMGMHVVVHGRDEARGMEVVRAIEAAGGTARFFRADFSSFAQTRAFGEAVLRDYDRLDLLVNNAGFGRAPDERMVSEDGLEFRIQVNHLSHFMLTRMWLPLLRASAPARVVNVASGAQQPIDFDDVMLERTTAPGGRFDGGRAYAQSKLAQIMFTIDLAEELAGTGIEVNALHPATFMDTRMVERAGIEPQSTVDEGADAVMHLITAPDLGSGGYFNQTRSARANAQAYDVEARRRLRELSEELTGVR
jgi:NAD(P)-dependent dehydrogenase (short-subunit alcohol dehydrogenase family)